MPYLLTANPSSPNSWVKMDTESVLSGHSELSGGRPSTTTPAHHRQRPSLPNGGLTGGSPVSQGHFSGSKYSNYANTGTTLTNGLSENSPLPNSSTSTSTNNAMTSHYLGRIQTPPPLSPTSLLSNYSLGLNANNRLYSNNVSMTPNHRTVNSVLTSSPSNRLNNINGNYGMMSVESPYQTAVTLPSTEAYRLANGHQPQSERIEVQILHQDNDWADNTTAVTGLSDLAYSPEAMGKWDSDREDPGNPEDDWKFQCQRYMGPWTAAIFSLIAFLSPILMLLIPQMYIIPFRESQLRCDVECDGALISFSFKLVILLFGTWAVFFRPCKATMPRIFLYRSAICVLILVFTFSFWLFYAVRLGGEQRRRIQYYDVVQYATSMVDALLFVHYLAVLLIELRHETPQFYLKVVRSPDGESKSYAIGQLSIQRAAVWVLEKYYTDFSIFNPYLERLHFNSPGHTGTAHRRRHNGQTQFVGSFKHYDIDGLGNSSFQVYEKDTLMNGSPIQGQIKRNSANHHSPYQLSEKFLEDQEYERRLKKRKARLVLSTEEAFAQIKRLNDGQSKTPSTPLTPLETAQAIFPTIARPLQKYLRITRQQPRHDMDSIVDHLATCLKYDLSPRAFLEKFLVTTPVLQNEREMKPVQTWALICDHLLSRSIKTGTMFQLRQGDVSLMCEVIRLPHFNITEEIIDDASNKFLLKGNSETPV
ncbi:hypothetical protein TCAL_07165 [Tigriopus californicus]|uniref:Vang-like protein n=1 Tax=Tigriopus californicus TaxID=6832 RepID=A0A553PLG4_TIGCA|nr:vang-like protein 1 [Tigriopus californicus]XP_059095758.1 vang-like protein 1 [Tigriopus californicus]TRY78520.1 hypothetical protein TCAL_07165 [Tigriopus californicus]|eukprot:TCALIF_07165-PA protein Name:"Similar to Vangl1 Vang-like protein 1 (Mus musculus)" AED:0.08 eAED:0.08 QI:423/0.85/0.87/1/0.85/0.87/8/289/703